MVRPPKPGAGRALVFDLDGTLVDSAVDIADALNRLLISEGLPALALSRVKRMIGDGTMVLVERGLAAHGVTPDRLTLPGLVGRMLDFYAERPVVSTVPYEGVFDTLMDLVGAGYSLAVCTNKAQRLAEAVLDETGLAPFFVATIGGDTAVGRKPEPGSLLEAIARAECDPAKAVMIGDSATDVAAARAAQIPVIAVTWGYCNTGPVEELGADFLIDRFDKLPARLSMAGK